MSLKKTFSEVDIEAQKSNLWYMFRAWTLKMLSQKAVFRFVYKSKLTFLSRSESIPEGSIGIFFGIDEFSKTSKKSQSSPKI